MRKNNKRINEQKHRIILHHTPRPHKRGEEGKQHDFAMVCILLNTFNAYESCERRRCDWATWKSKYYEWELKDKIVDASFKSNCIALADKLFKYAITL
jgi:hypothetical protein